MTLSLETRAGLGLALAETSHLKQCLRAETLDVDLGNTYVT